MYHKDADHLRLLSTLHFVLAGLMGLFACLPLIHVTLGIMMLRSPDFMASDPSGPPPPMVGWLFVALGTLFFLAGWALVAALVVTGRRLRQRTHHTFCMVVAAVSCMFMPLGTALGVFSLMILTKPHVRGWFDQVPLPADPALAAAGGHPQAWR